ncbi:uncharacterized protein At4g14100-like [Nicotiana tabacum]|uniref:Uncharacterized protein At4g14100-like n=1 Tax=Nicotiana tabacum TaxID=4097 RepID=A0A1S4BFF9_TOBAC|nr:PREDICTED: uncharacterized protein At4g14100-like [Nicotiana tabacum]
MRSTLERTDNHHRLFKAISVSMRSVSFVLVVVAAIWISNGYFIHPCSSLVESDPKPAPWPHQFHSLLFVNYSGSLSLIDLWYDWTNGRNFNIIQNQLGKLLYDLEWNNGTSFFYTLDDNKECRSAQLDVGILRPNWLDGATYLGQRSFDGFLCNVWQKVDFIWYYEDVFTKRPVHWVFYTGRSIHVMTFEVGAALEDAKWQAPVYCFENKKPNEHPASEKSIVDIGFLEYESNGILREFV